MAQYEPEWLMFAGDATWGIIWGVVFLLLSGVALWRDRLRNKRTRPEQVGCMPWTTISIVLIFAAAAAFLFAIKS